MSQFLEWMYIACLTLLTLFLVKRSGSSHKFILFLVVFWLWALTVPAIENLIIPVTKGFEIQPSRLLLFIFLPYILMQSLTGKRPRFLQASSYEKFLIAFYFAGLIALIYHLGNAVDFRETVVIYTGWLTFAAVYIILKQNADEGMIKGILLTFIFLGILSSVVALIQFLVFPDFLRGSFERTAFRGYLRSNGLFRDEYVHSCFCIIASYATFLFIKNRLNKVLILATLGIGVALSFHRASWIIYLFTFTILYFYLSNRKATAYKILAGVTIVLLTISVYIWFESSRKSGFVQDRLLDDTATTRVSFYEVAIQRISEEWLFGVGSIDTRAYYHDAVVSGHEEATRRVGGIHNLYLFLAYFYGIPVALSFSGFLVAAGIFFWKGVRHGHIFYFLPALTVLMFIVVNLTQWIPPNQEIAIYIAVIMGLSISVLKNGLEDQISI